MTEVPSWNETPFTEDAEPEVKAYEFDAQLRENGGDPEVTKGNAQK